MSMKSLRNMVYQQLLADAALSTLGVVASNLFPNFSPGQTDSPQGMRFVVIRWSSGLVSSIRTVKPVLCELWAYDSEPDFSWIDDVLFRCRTVMGGLVSLPIDATPSGWVIGVDWQGTSVDLRDDVYDANARSEGYQITASGI